MAETTGTTGIWNGGTTASTSPTLPSGSGGLVLAWFFWKGSGAIAAPTPDTPGDWDGDTSFTQDGTNDLNSEVFWTDAASPDMDFTFASAPVGAICVTIRIDDAATGGDIDVASMIEDVFSFDDPWDPGNVSSAPDGRVLLGVMRTFNAWNLGASTSLYSASNPAGSGFRLDSVDVEVLDADGTAGGGTQDLSTIDRGGTTGNILAVGLVVAKAAAGGTDATATPAAITTTTTVSASASGTTVVDATATPAAITTTTTVDASASGTTVVDATATPAAITTTTTVSASASGTTVGDGTATPAAITTTTTVGATASGTTVIDATATPGAVTTTTTVAATASGTAGGDATATPAAITTTTVVSGAASGTSVIDATATPAAITVTTTVSAVGVSAEALYYFTPPTRAGLSVQAAETKTEARTKRNRLFRRLVPPPIGRAVLLNGSTYTVLDQPTAAQVNAADKAYLGGRRHLVTFAEKEALEAAGVGGTFEAAD